MAGALFLSTEEMQELTGISKGRDGLTREQRQIDWLRGAGIPFWTNARGVPKVTRSAIEGRQASQDAPPVRGWIPRVVVSPFR
ncbi:DUF4224 domain-containing protein [Chitiniphilus eburneus]|uniref:DUF4224 domain-containing protein n=1 Tax=Chitiniphilus eburneus TaxID=2571148 RepID=UPI0035CF9D09